MSNKNEIKEDMIKEDLKEIRNWLRTTEGKIQVGFLVLLHLVLFLFICKLVFIAADVIVGFFA